MEARSFAREHAWLRGIDFGHDHPFDELIYHGCEARAVREPPGTQGRDALANHASRLCDQAKDGQILVDINVFSAVENRQPMSGFRGKAAVPQKSRDGRV